MRILALLFFTLLSTHANAEGDCLERFLVVDREETWDFRRPGQADYLLPTFTGNGSYLTKAAAHYKWSGPNGLLIRFDFALPPGQVSYPYNIYKIAVDIGSDHEADAFHFEKDYTNDCNNGGVGILPGQEIIVPKVKIPQHSNGDPRELEQVRIRVWGLHF
jgi:hypothetical protein